MIVHRILRVKPSTHSLLPGTDTEDVEAGDGFMPFMDDEQESYPLRKISSL